jgi:pimeloyl-ACP methyl ester carboxylesterase
MRSIDAMRRAIRLWLIGGIAIGVLASASIARGDAPMPTTAPAVDFSRTWLLHLPGIGGIRGIDRRMTHGLKDGGWNGTITLYDWTEHDPGLDALLNHDRNMGEAVKVASQIEERLTKDPQLEITLTAHSGGTGIAVWALERLPEGMKVQTLVLLASALSPDYDLSKALGHVRGKAYVFYSQNDQVVLGAGTKLFGTIDGVKSEAAGLSGFREPPDADKARYEKLVQRPYDKGWIAFENIGNHVGCMSQPFAQNVLAPMLIDDLDIRGTRRAAARRK